MIVVKYKKVMKKGVKKVLITEVKALTKEELPERYLDGAPRVWLEQDSYGYFHLRGVNENGYPVWLSEGSMYDPDDFQKTIEFLVKCGERLKEINEEIRRERKHWVDGKVHEVRI